MRRLGYFLCVLCSWLSLTAAALELPISTGGVWQVEGVAQTDATFESHAATTQQRPRLWFDTRLRGDVDEQLRVVVGLRGVWGGPPVHPEGIGFVSLRDTFQDLSPAVELDEAYAEWHSGAIDLRLGKQRFAWGRLDLQAPTDLLNPRRFDDPFRISPEDSKIGVPAARLTWAPPHVRTDWLDDAAATLVWIPWRIPFRFPLADERWFPEAANVPAMLHLPAGLFDIGVGADVATELHETNNPPALQLDEGSLALRLSGSSYGIDWTLFGYQGAETNPAFDLNTTVSAPLVRAKLQSGAVVLLSDLRQLDASATLTPRYARLAAGGADLAFQLGAASLRAEVLYGRQRLLPRRTEDLYDLANLQQSICGDPACSGVTPLLTALLGGATVTVPLGDLFVRRDTIEWGIAADHPIGSWLPLLQLNQTLLLHDDDRLLVPRVDTRLLLGLRRDFLGDQLRLDLLAQQGMPRSYSTAIVRWTYHLTDSLHLRCGYLLLAGTRRSIVGQYQNNDETFVELRFRY